MAPEPEKEKPGSNQDFLDGDNPYTRSSKVERDYDRMAAKMLKPPGKKSFRRRKNSKRMG